MYKKLKRFCFICLFSAFIVTSCTTVETKESDFLQESETLAPTDETDTTYTVEKLRQNISDSYKNAEILDLQVSEMKAFVSGAAIISRSHNGLHEMGIIVVTDETLVSYINLNSKEVMFDYIPGTLGIDHDSDSIVAGMRDKSTNVEYIYTIEVSETLDNGVKGVNLIVSRK